MRRVVFRNIFLHIIRCGTYRQIVALYSGEFLHNLQTAYHGIPYGTDSILPQKFLCRFL